MMHRSYGNRETTNQYLPIVQAIKEASQVWYHVIQGSSNKLIPLQ